MTQITESWTAYQFDAAVNLLGTVLENAAQEMHNVGTEKSPKWETKYKLSQLLDQDFRLPESISTKMDKQDAIGSLKALASTGGVKVFKGA